MIDHPAAPETLDARQLREIYGFRAATADRIIRHCPRIRIGRTVRVRRADVEAFIERHTEDADGFRRPA